MTLEENICAIINCNFTETKEEIREFAVKSIVELLRNNTNSLSWMTAAEGREETYGRLYLAYQPGYPLMIADWKTGHGYRDVRTGDSIRPTRVAYINLPDGEEF